MRAARQPCCASRALMTPDELVDDYRSCGFPRIPRQGRQRCQTTFARSTSGGAPVIADVACALSPAPATPSAGETLYRRGLLPSGSRCGPYARQPPPAGRRCRLRHLSPPAAAWGRPRVGSASRDPPAYLFVPAPRACRSLAYRSWTPRAWSMSRITDAPWRERSRGIVRTDAR